MHNVRGNILNFPEEIIEYIMEKCDETTKILFSSTCKSLLKANSLLKQTSTPRFMKKQLLLRVTECSTIHTILYFFPPIRQIQWNFNCTDLLASIVSNLESRYSEVECNHVLGRLLCVFWFSLESLYKLKTQFPARRDLIEKKIQTKLLKSQNVA